MFTLRENMLFCEKWTRSFELESVLLNVARDFDERKMSSHLPGAVSPRLVVQNLLCRTAGFQAKPKM
jgi:hypothetical protein